MQKSDLPFGSEFSPSQVELPHLLELAHMHGGDWKAFEVAVMREYFLSHQTSAYNQRKLANNTKLGMIAYGIIDRDAQLTSFGRALYDKRNDIGPLYGDLARHILLDLNGMNLVQCVEDMRAAGENVELVALRRWLEERGIHFPRGGKHPSIMRLWLEKAGVFVEGWRIDQERLTALVGLPSNEIEVLATLSPEQRAYLKTLANMGGPGPYASNEVEKLATATFGISFNEKNLPKAVLYPLQEAGYVTLVRGTRAAGRGAKPFMVMPSSKLVAEVLAPLLKQVENLTAADLRPLLRKPLGEILRDLDSRDRHRAGLALEALAFKLMRLVDLSYVATRLRGAATGGAEVDLIFESSRLVYSRWQVQCKNTARVSLDDVAKEVGLTYQTGSQVLLFVGMGGVDKLATELARAACASRPLQIAFLTRRDLKAIVERPLSIVERIARQAPLALCTTSQFSPFLEKTAHASASSLSVA